MKLLNLNSDWTMIYGTKEEKGTLKHLKLEKDLLTKSFPCEIPTTMYEVLEKNNAINNPFYRDNEYLYTELSKISCTFVKHFDIDKEILQYERINLCLNGLDTLATIFVNDNAISTTKNMHIGYLFNIKPYIKEKNNCIKIYFAPPIQAMKDQLDKRPQWGVPTCMEGYSYLRKSQTQSGWDWGIRLPDMGIWRDIYIEAYNITKIKDIYISQKHYNQGKVVKLDCEIEISKCEFSDTIDLVAEVFILDPNGNLVDTKQVQIYNEIDNVQFILNEPKLWWPNNLGEQPLYKVSIFLYNGKERISKKEINIGIRTITIDQSKRDKGRNFAFVCNGVEFFSMGANYIPNDAIIPRGEQKGKLSKLLKDCQLANYNTIRVWGGGVYPNDEFYDTCDRLGLVVWQDMMFACGIYHTTEKFLKSVKEEIQYNLRRIRNHASLGLICANNEMEAAFDDAKNWGIDRNSEMDNEYLLLYENLIPNILTNISPQTAFWPSSPSSGGGFRDPSNDYYGDVHYWKVYHGNEHYKHFRDHYFRFASEFGMQAFPDYRTINSFANEDERSPLSHVMEIHNKVINPYNGNIKILSNIALEFNIPSSFEDLVYISQIFQGEAIRVATEHFRANRGRCMGATYWQLNDDYPVISWSSIDYYGRWKALHYYAKRFFSPILLIAKENKTSCNFYINNETKENFSGHVICEIRDKDCNIIKSKKEKVKVTKMSALSLFDINIEDLVTKNGREPSEVEPLIEYNDEIKNYFVSYKLVNDNNKVISQGTQLFVNSKWFKFKKANIKLCINQNKLTLTSDVFAKAVTIYSKANNLILSDNSFDLLKNEERTIEVLRGKLELNDLVVKCINNVEPLK